MGILKASDSGGDENAEERPGEGSAVLNAEQALLCALARVLR